MIESKLFGSNRDEYEQYAREGIKCHNYEGCSICFKCKVKAWHIYEKCNRCEILHCYHKEADRQKLIKPKNFTYNKEDSISKSINKVYDEYKNSIREDSHGN